MSPFLTFRALPVGPGYRCFIDSFHQESLCFDNTVILHVFILRFFCVIRGRGMMNFVSGSLFSSYMAFHVLYSDEWG